MANFDKQAVITRVRSGAHGNFLIKILASIAAILPGIYITLVFLSSFIFGWTVKGTYLGLFLYLFINAGLGVLSALSETTYSLWVGLKWGHPLIWALGQAIFITWCVTYAPWIG